MTRPPLDAAHLPELLDDLDHSVSELLRLVDDPVVWMLGPAPRWNVGQHVEHVARSMALSAEAFERASDALARGALEARPWRDPLQWVFVRVVTGARFPRGGRSPAVSTPQLSPDRERVLYDVAEGARRHRTIVDRLTPEAREQLWIWNPFVPKFRWHYTLPEMVRVQANHNRHHARTVSEAIAAPIGSGPAPA
jgi:hypothetical protein